MIKTFVAIGLGAVIVFAPLAAMAQSDPLTRAGAALTARHMRHSRNAHKERARAGAEHMRTMRHAPARRSQELIGSTRRAAADPSRQRALVFVVRRLIMHRTGFYAPNLLRVLPDRTVARELARTGKVENDLFASIRSACGGVRIASRRREDRR